MKRSACLFLLLAVAACSTTEYVDIEDDGVLIVLNAQMSTAEETHTVYLSTGHISTVAALRGADVSVYVNGVFVTDAQEVGATSVVARYEFAAPFRPGDEVRITARKDGLSAESTVTVPAAAPILSVDTLSVRSMLWGDSEEYLQIKVRFQDIPDERTWYRVGVRLSEESTYTSNGVQHISRNTSPMRLETGSDPIINEGGGSSSGDLMSFLSPENAFAVFSDNAFADQMCTIRTYLYKSHLYFLYRDARTEPTSPSDARVTRRLIFDLYTLGFDQYHYLKALDNMRLFDYEASFIVEPTTLPSNVTGGLGFVAVDAVSSYAFVENVSYENRLYY